MKTISCSITKSVEKIVDLPLSKKEQIISYYEKAGRDYHTWSKKYNMHFGYYEKGMNPFRRETMLEKLNEKVFNELAINIESNCDVADFGCGLGATVRYGAKKFPHAKFKGITLVPWQVTEAVALNDKHQLNGSIEIIEGDYCNTPFETESLDCVLAIESSCYANGENKADLLREIHRVLKPGGRFVIADGFVKKEIPQKGLLGQAYEQLCNSWALTELGSIDKVQRYLEHLGFRDIRLNEVSMNIAPSVAHVPFTVLYFLVKQFLFGKEKMSKERWDNLKSPLLTMILGSARSYFGYYFVSGTK